MVFSETNISSPSLSPSPPRSLSVPPVVASPCAACKTLRRRCIDKCILAPYFPPSEPLKFTAAHRVFGASNIAKILQELPKSQRADAVSSMVYEASARISDPVYGCAGAICQLQKQVIDLQTQLAKTQAALRSMQDQHPNPVAIICMEMAQSQQLTPQPFDIINTNLHMIESNSDFLDDDSVGSLWEPLWT